MVSLRSGVTKECLKSKGKLPVEVDYFGYDGDKDRCAVFQ